MGQMENQNTKDKLESGFEQIINYFVKKGELHQKLEKKLKLFIEYLINQTENTKKRLSEVVEKFNYETISPNEDYNTWPILEFWRGVDDYSSVVGLNYDGDIDILDEEEPILLQNQENKNDTFNLIKEIKIDLEKYPISSLGYYEYKFNEKALFYAWISFLWQEIEGYKSGIKVCTVENNSISIFSLNDFLNDNFSEFIESDSGEKPPKLKSFFHRKLSLIEFFLRASQTSYPFNPYNNYWRYFEKDDDYIEIVTYAFLTGIRTGKKHNSSGEVNQVEKHNSSGSVLKLITEFTNKMIFEGWEEKLRPLDFPEKMHENAFEFNIWTDLNGNS